MRPPRRHPLSAAHDRSPPPRFSRGTAAPSDRPRGVPRRGGGPMRSPFAERETERLIAALLPDVAFDGWTRHALRSAARRADIPVGDAAALHGAGAMARSGAPRPPSAGDAAERAPWAAPPLRHGRRDLAWGRR